MHTRLPAVAGMFYPLDARELEEQVTHMLDEAKVDGTHPKAIIAPHAGYMYSGPIAASVYKLIAPVKDKIKTVVLFGPSHRVAFSGLALSQANAFATPLGNIPVNKEKSALILTLPQVQNLEQAHTQEHSLEVQLPFLQQVLDEFDIVPIVIGDAEADDVAEVMDKLWDDDSTLIVVSSDLSHYHSYDVDQRMDAETSAAIERLDPEDIGVNDACGRNPIKGLLTLARDRKLRVKTLDLRNSGDTAGTKDSVVGYGAYVIY